MSCKNLEFSRQKCDSAAIFFKMAAYFHYLTYGYQIYRPPVGDSLREYTLYIVYLGVEVIYGIRK